MTEGVTSALAAGFFVALCLIAILGWFCYRLLLDRGRLLLRLSSDTAGHERPIPQGLPSGAFLSDFALAKLPGNESETERIITLSGLSGQPLLLVFAHTDCLFSRLVAHELGRVQPNFLAPRPVIILMGAFGDPAMTALWRDLPCLVLRDLDGQVARLMRVSATPAGYRMDAERRTSGSLLIGPAALLATAQGIGSEDDLRPVAVTPLPARDAAAWTPLAPGESAPDFTVPMLGGGRWSLADQRGIPFILLFSDPTCPPCRTLLATLDLPPTAAVVLVSRGDPEANRQLVAERGLAAPVVLQRQREVARLFRTLDTPAAFAIDARGVIAAGPAIGAEAIAALIAQSA